MTGEKNIERENRILDSARELLLHYGYDKTTVSDIAREAGISKGAIYLHFTSKDDLINALLDREMHDYADDTMRMLEDDEESWSFVGMYQKTLQALPKYPMVRAVARGDTHVFGAFLNRFSDRFVAIKRQSRLPMLTMMQSAGALRADLDMAHVAYILDCFGYGMLHAREFMKPEDVPDVEDITQTIGDMLERFLIPEDGGNPNAARDIVIGFIRQYREQTQNQTERTD